MKPFIPPFDFYNHLVQPWTMGGVDTAWTVCMGALVAIACGWIGCYLILQGMSLIGDAISHTVLLGIVVAFLLTGQIGGPAIFLGATLTGLVTTVLIESLHSSSRIKEDAAIGIVFTSMFALGVVLLSTLAGHAHIDTQHVLYGDIALSLLEATTIGPLTIPVTIVQMAVVVLIISTLIVAFYKELLIVAFDPQLADVMGLRPHWFRYGLMSVLSVTVVSSFEAVGAILVVAMLIAPAATAYLLTDRLPAMFAISAVAGTLSSLIGYHTAVWLEVSTGGAMVCAACGLFGIAFLFSPTQGVLATAWRRARLRLRTGEENIVRNLLKLSPLSAPSTVSIDQLISALGDTRWQVRWMLSRLLRRGWIAEAAGASGAYQLTETGIQQAQRLERAHRLWEMFLVDQVGLASDHVHPAAEDVEHLLSEQLVERVDDVLGHPDTDPHGSPIPRSAVSEHLPGVFTLSKLRIGDRGRIFALADGPTTGMQETPPTAQSGAAARVRASVAALGLPLGQPITVVDRNTADESWTIQLADGKTINVEHRLADSILVRL